MEGYISSYSTHGDHITSDHIHSEHIHSEQRLKAHYYARWETNPQHTQDIKSSQLLSADKTPSACIITTHAIQENTPSEEEVEATP